MRRFWTTLVVLALAGCTSLPSDGPVLVGGPITVEGNTAVEYLPAGPAEGATPREILDGFIAAGSAPQNNFRIARSFLTDAIALTWNPGRETIVRGVYAKVETNSSTELTYTTSVIARVDESGVFQPSVSVKPASWSFTFTRVNGEWRLSSVPDVTLVTEVAFASAYDEYTVYFYNSDRTAFVPDVRVFARQADPVTSVARAVIAGPSRYLPNASTAFPPESTLAVAPVEVVSGRAIVDVSADVAQESMTNQQEMLSEMGVSLGALPEVTSTALSINRVPLSISAIPGIDSNPRVDDRPLIMYKGDVGYSAGVEIDRLPQNSDRIANLNPTSISYDSATGAAAVGTRLGVYLVGDRTERISDQASLVDPQIDGSKSVWWVSRNSPNVIILSVGGRQITINGPWSRNDHIVGLEVSREDARIAVAVNDKRNGNVYVGAISMDDAGRPDGVSGFRSLPVIVDNVIDLAWSDATHVALLGIHNSVVHAEIVTVGGRATLLGQPQNPTRISGGNTGVAGLVVLAQNGQLWTPRGAGWQSTGIPADVLATQH